MFFSFDFLFENIFKVFIFIFRGEEFSPIRQVLIFNEERVDIGFTCVESLLGLIEIAVKVLFIDVFGFDLVILMEVFFEIFGYAF